MSSYEDYLNDETLKSETNLKGFGPYKWVE
jgi:hypothetical protein